MVFRSRGITWCWGDFNSENKQKCGFLWFTKQADGEPDMLNEQKTMYWSFMSCIIRLLNCVMGLRVCPGLNAGKLMFVGVYAVTEQHFFFFYLFIWSLEFCMWQVGRPNKKDFKNIDIYLSIFANKLLICSGFVYLVRVCLFEAHFCILLWCMSFYCIFGCKVCTCGALVLVQHICLFACVASVCSVNVHEVVSLMFLLSFAVISCCVLSPLGLAWNIDSLQWAHIYGKTKMKIFCNL